VQALLRAPADRDRRGGCSAWRWRSSLPRRGGVRWCQAPSTSSRRAWREPVLVIAPRRRRQPGESSLATSPRKLAGCPAREARKVADLAARPDRRRRLDAAQTAQPLDLPRPPDCATASVIARPSWSRRCSSTSTAPGSTSSVAREGRVLELDVRQPAAVRLAPCAPVEPQPVAQQRLREPIARASDPPARGAARPPAVAAPGARPCGGQS
jgi:hypothetical protein